jgi:hypothetical protein
MSEIVTDEEAQDALDNLLQYALPAAKAIAEASYMDDYTRVVKARLMGNCNEPTAAAQERYAYAHPDYEAHLQAKRTAVEKAERARFLTRAEQIRIDVWKAQEYRNRQMEKL